MLVSWQFRASFVLVPYSFRGSFVLVSRFFFTLRSIRNRRKSKNGLRKTSWKPEGLDYQHEVSC